MVIGTVTIMKGKIEHGPILIKPVVWWGMQLSTRGAHKSMYNCCSGKMMGKKVLRNMREFSKRRVAGFVGRVSSVGWSSLE